MRSIVARAPTGARAGATRQPNILACSRSRVPITRCCRTSSLRSSVVVPRHIQDRRVLGKKWKQYQGINNWEGLLDPLDDTLRGEILRYGKFVEATYSSVDFDTTSPSYARCRFPGQSVLSSCGLSGAGYELTRNLHANSGVQLPRWFEKFPSWVSKQSSWIGYVAVCTDEEEISRLGRRDVVIAYRGTVTCLEWLENLRSTLTQLPGSTSEVGPMVESGFLSLYTSSTDTCRSLQDEVREEVAKILETYGGDEPISLTITGHSLGAALATLTAYDVTKTFDHPPSVTVISFGGPRVGDRRFKMEVEKCGTKILRIVNPQDIITKVPGFVLNDDVGNEDDSHVASPGVIPSWFQKRVEDTQWVYADVGRELRLSSKRHSSILGGAIGNVATCHDLDTYLDLVNCSMTSTCPIKLTASKMRSTHLNHQHARRLQEARAR